MVQTLETPRPAVRPPKRLRAGALSAHYEALWQRIQDADLGPSTSPTIGVMSCAPRAGVSTITFNLALTAARNQNGRVLYINADFNALPNRGSIGATTSQGMADVLAGTAAPLECVNLTADENLFFLSARGTSSQGVSRIDLGRLSDTLSDYKQDFNLIVVDIPAPTELNCSVRLASQMDGVVLVIEAEQADGCAALRTKQQLTDAGANILGVVLNKRRKYVPEWLYRLL